MRPVSKTAFNRTKSAPRKELTLDLIYSETGLSGKNLSQVQWSPDGKLITYLCGEGNLDQIRAYEVATKKSRVLFDFAKILDTHDGKYRRQWFWDAHKHKHHLPWRIMRRFDATNTLTPSFQWSPNGQQLLLSASTDGPRYLFNLATETLSSPLWIDKAANDLEFSPDGQWLSYVLGYNLYVVNLSTGEPIAVTHGGSEPLRFATPDTYGDFLQSGYWWSPDSTHIACLFTDERSVLNFPIQNLVTRVPDIDYERFSQPGGPVPVVRIMVLTSGGRMTWIDTGAWPGYYLARVDWLPDSRRLAIQLMGRNQDHLVLVIADSISGQCFPVLEERDRAWINLSYDLWFFENASYFLWSSERNSYRHLYLYRIDGQMVAQLTSGDCACVQLMGVDETNRDIYFQAYPHPYINGHLMKVSYEVGPEGIEPGPVKDLTRTPGNHSAMLSPDLTYFADLYSTAETPPRLDLYRSDGTFVVTAQPNAVPKLREYLAPVEFLPPIRPAKIGDPSDNMPLCARMIRPPGMREGKKYPVIIYVYGGPVPGGTGRTVVNYWCPVPDLWLQMMAQKGYIVFSVDNRGTSEALRGHDFETPIFTNLGGVELADQLEGVKYLKSLPFVDHSRIGIFGGSFGGYMVLNAMLRAPNVFKAGVAYAPVTGWLGFDTIYTETYMNRPEENPLGYESTKIPPLAPNLRGKLLLLHGTKDLNVHLQQTGHLVMQLTVAGKHFDLMIYPDQGHASFFELAEVPKHMFARITKFFLDNL